MHKYFLIPILIFFFIVSLLVFYLQYISEEWKYRIIGKKDGISIPKNCNDKSEIVKIINNPSDIIKNRSFKDRDDLTSDFQFHAIYLLPCEKEDRKFDINKNIYYSLNSINKWLLNRTKNQLINFDITEEEYIDITFIRVDKTIKWFTKFNSNENNQLDAASKIEKIILLNAHLFNNFDKKKFIVFFEGWEKRRSLITEICGRSRFNGKVSIFYTNAKMKKSKSCTKDNINDSIYEGFGESEGTILHEMLHTLGMPPKCAKNLDSNSTFHVSDNNEDIMNKVSGSKYLDYNNDDYYKHNIKNCKDLTDNEYLVHSKN